MNFSVTLTDSNSQQIYLKNTDINNNILIIIYKT